jgi:Secretion system C-terminal sorting domain
MKFYLGILILILPMHICGQYHYYNEVFYPPGWAEGNDVGNTNIMLRSDTVITFGRFTQDNLYHHQFLEFDISGNMIGETVNPFEPNVSGYIEYEESMTPASNNCTVWAASVLDPQYPSLCATCVKFNTDFSRQWTRNLAWTLSDTAYSAFHCAQEISNFNIVAAGIHQVDFGPDFNDDSSRLLIGKYAADGDSIWEKTIPLYEAGLTGDKRYLRINHIFEQPNGDLLLSGALMFDWDQCFIRLTGEGEFISMFTMGGPLNDWLPWCAKRDDGKILFGYHYCTEYFIDSPWLPVYNLNTGLFDPEIMDTLWTKSHDHTAVLQWNRDFEVTADGGGIMLSDNATYAIDPENGIDGPGAYLLKVDSLGNEEWFRKVPSPIALPNDAGGQVAIAYGIEVLPDGGFVGVGNLNPEGANANQFVTWTWRTDCMGNLELPPISFEPQINQVNDSTFFCTSGTENVYDVTWNFGNGDVVVGDTVTYTYNSNGAFDISIFGHYCIMDFDSTFSVNVTDCMGNTSTPTLELNAEATEVSDSTYMFSSAPENLENITWFFPDGEVVANEVQYSFPDTGTFAIEVCGWYCDSLVCTTLEITISTGLYDYSTDHRSGLIISPNPSNDFIYLMAQSNIQHASIKDLTGRLVITTRPNAKSCLIDVSSLPNGTYLVEASFEGALKETVKLVVDRE